MHIRHKFQELAKEWDEDTRHLSNVTTITNHPAYQEIIKMGLPVVPYILDDLALTNNDWFTALTIITGENPITEEIAGHVNLMAQAWLELACERPWGEHEELVIDVKKYRLILYYVMLDIRTTNDLAFAKKLADVMHNLALFSADDFKGFDEDYFWYECSRLDRDKLAALSVIFDEELGCEK